MRRVIFVLVSAACITLLLLPRPWLVLRDREAGRTLVEFPADGGDTFKICYIHSVDIKPVCEIFSVRKEHGIFLEEMYFVMFGAGMGHWEGHGHVSGDGEWIRIKEINKPVGKFLLRAGSKDVNHRLVIREMDINLTDLAEGRVIEVKMEFRPMVLSILLKLRFGDV